MKLFLLRLTTTAVLLVMTVVGIATFWRCAWSNFFRMTRALWRTPAALKAKGPG